MNICRTVTLLSALTALQPTALCKPHVKSEDTVRLYSRVVTRRDELENLERVLPKPTARSEPAFAYEGEDIALVGIMAANVNPDSLRRAIRRRDDIPTMIRVFKSQVELTDSLLKPPWSDIRPQISRAFAIIKLGDSATWKVSGLAAGEYWGVLDAGVISDRFSIHVEPLPETLKSIAVSFFRLREMQPDYDNPYSYRRIPEEFWPEIRDYANSLTPYPEGTPLRVEALRLCMTNLPTTGRGYFESGDSLLMFNLLREYVREPRHERQQLVWGLERLCGYHMVDSCMIQLAEDSGDTLILQEVMAWKYKNSLKQLRQRHH